ncbi:hypothetical protein STEG23_015972, partial [Scotinomys teguina]
DHIPVPYQPDSSSNPSSTTSSTPSSPAPPLPPSATPPSPLHPSPQCTRQKKNFNLPASHYYKYKQQFIFPDVVPVPETPTRAPQVILHPVTSNTILEGNPLLQIEVEPTSENEEGHDEAEESEDDFEEMNRCLLSARSFPRKASQTSIFLQEWDIPFEQLEIGELIGKGRFGQVYHGRWHGEVAIRLIDIERDNEDQLKAFKREVMAYRQTRHENVVLFMGACMSPPHLAIITRTDHTQDQFQHPSIRSFATSAALELVEWQQSRTPILCCHRVNVGDVLDEWPGISHMLCDLGLCKGRTLYSVVRDAKIVLDVNKTRQIAQEIVKGMGYLHAKGILHKDLKSKNVFYDNGKVVITDFGLFSISGVLQAGRREDKLRIQNGWLCHLAPEIIRQLSPDTEEDKLPFSKHSDVFALGTIWYELHAREWPFKTQPAEAIIWQMGAGMKPNLSQIGMGKEISLCDLDKSTGFSEVEFHALNIEGGETHSEDTMRDRQGCDCGHGPASADLPPEPPLPLCSALCQLRRPSLTTRGAPTQPSLGDLCDDLDTVEADCILDLTLCPCSLHITSPTTFFSPPEREAFLMTDPLGAGEGDFSTVPAEEIKVQRHPSCCDKAVFGPPQLWFQPVLSPKPLAPGAAMSPTPRKHVGKCGERPRKHPLWDYLAIP